LEGILRGYRAGFLKREDYTHMGQCDTLEDIRLYMASSSDYGDFLANEQPPLHTTTIAERCTERMVHDFLFIRNQATEPLATFLDYISYQYMIDNVILLITGSLHESSLPDLIEKCHPLGKFDTMATLSATSTISDLYNTVLIDTPLGPYMHEIISEEDLDEMNIEIIRNTLYKAYLEDFLAFCQNLGGETSKIMTEILEFEADRRAINITINSIGTELTKDERRKLYPNFGKLWPEYTERLSKCEDIEQVHAVIESMDLYRPLLREATSRDERSLEDSFFDYEVGLNELAFWKQYHYGIFYSWVKLKEQEVRNVVWIAECVQHRQKNKVDQIISIFDKERKF